ncbi:MAG: hypothetical protein K6B75_03565, partial [Lachnospiraceae bacterium]|nr:hypothetical protein [Lachnospiraceae bacterium]
TQYAHFANADMKYHFMFEFLAGNLEFLGLRLDIAFNFPSIMGMVSAYLLLFAFAVRLTKSRLAAFIATLLFTFRSSFSVFKFMAEQPKGRLWDAIKNISNFIGYTEHEDWGLWNLNVYANQRHLAFSLAILLFALMVFHPYVYAMDRKMKSLFEDRKFNFILFFKNFFLTRTAFGVKNIKFSVGMGLVLGSIAFWNGSVLIATMSMLFFMAAVSDYRLDYLIAAVIALVLGLLQSHFFITGSAVYPEYFFGFLAENKNFFGVLVYIFELTGIVILLAFITFLKKKRSGKYMLFVFFVPTVLAFTVSLIKTNNTAYYIAVNHKWIMMTLMLISIYAAELLAELFEKKDFWCRLAALLLTFILTATGVFDLHTVIVRNKYPITYAWDDPVTKWVEENATCKDIFLVPQYSLNRLTIGGAMLFYGWPYYSTSAGYETEPREFAMIAMYEAPSVEILQNYTAYYGIRYIVVDRDARECNLFRVREDIISQAFECVYAQDEGTDWSFKIYDTDKPLNRASD